MGLLNRLKPKVDTESDSPEAREDDDERRIRVTVFPSDGGKPYIRDVEVDDDGLFALDQDSGAKYMLTRGSVWVEGGVERAVVCEESERTVNPSSLVGDDIMSPRTLHGIAERNLLAQWDDLQRRRGFWTQGSTWLMITLAVTFLVMVLWQIKTVGDGFEQLADAIRAAELSTGGSARHQPIAPGGR